MKRGKIGILISLLREEYEIRPHPLIHGPSSVKGRRRNIRLRPRFAKFNLNLKFRGYYRRNRDSQLFNVWCFISELFSGYSYAIAPWRFRDPFVTVSPLRVYNRGKSLPTISVSLTPRPVNGKMIERVWKRILGRIKSKKS